MSVLCRGPRESTRAMAICATLTPFCSANLPQRLDEVQVVLEVVVLEARRHRPEVAGAELPVGGEVARDQAPGEHAVRRDADAQFARGGDDLVLDAARDEGVLDLEVGDRRGGGGPADRVGADLICWPPSPASPRCCMRTLARLPRESAAARV